MSTPFTELPEADQLARLHGLATAALARYGLAADCPVTLVNNSENATYAVDLPETGERRFLRIHRTHYHSDYGIRSELLWMNALREATGLVTPEAIPGLDGDELQIVETPEMGEARRVVLFKEVRGVHPSEVDIAGPFRRLGAIAAAFHDHVMTWPRPGWFERLTWNFETTVGDTPNWGRWQDAPGVTPAHHDVLARAVELAREKLEAFGKAPERYNLTHADLRIDNFLVEDGEPRILDFDDSGFSWLLYDAATAVSFMEEQPDLETLLTNWVEGYREVRELPVEDVRMIPTFVQLRRIMIMGWIASHPKTDLARDTGGPYTEGSVRLAQAYLDGRFLTGLD